jgi:hypothetical protein
VTTHVDFWVLRQLEIGEWGERAVGLALMHARQPRSHRWREGKSGFLHAKRLEDPLPHDFA